MYVYISNPFLFCSFPHLVLFYTYLDAQHSLLWYAGYILLCIYTPSKSLCVKRTILYIYIYIYLLSIWLGLLYIVYMLCMCMHMNEVTAVQTVDVDALGQFEFQISTDRVGELPQADIRISVGLDVSRKDQAHTSDNGIHDFHI